MAIMLVNALSKSSEARKSCQEIASPKPRLCEELKRSKTEVVANNRDELPLYSYTVSIISQKVLGIHFAPILVRVVPRSSSAALHPDFETHSKSF